MKVDGKPWRPIWLEDDGRSVGIIDQTRLHFALVSAFSPVFFGGCAEKAVCFLVDYVRIFAATTLTGPANGTVTSDLPRERSDSSKPP